MSFDDSFNEVIMTEGGYVDHPLDRGGKTKYGISQRSYPDLDIPGLTLEDARAIYKRDYWDVLNLDLIKSDLISNEMFDTAVNMGPGIAAECAQKACNLFFPGSLKVDRDIGPKSVKIINQTATRSVYALFKMLNGFQFMEYIEIIEHRSDQVVFIKGWMKRIQDFRRQET